MKTEIADIADIEGWVLYDADCPFCRRMANWARRTLQRRRLTLEPLQTPWVRQRLQMPETQLLAEMRFLLPDGKCFGGAEALLEIARHVWWARPIRLFARVPGARAALHAAYRWVAANRGCTGGRCALRLEHTHRHTRRLRFSDWLPLLLLLVAAFSLRPFLARWMCLGGSLAGGRQYVSWIHETDFCRIADRLIHDANFSGPVNVVAPYPVTNAELMQTVRTVCGRRFGVPTPRVLLEWGAVFLRNETELVIKSRRVIPQKLLAAGFEFRFLQLRGAVEDLNRQLAGSEGC